MKVAVLVITSEWGGAENHTIQLARTLGGRGHKVTVVCLTRRTFELYRNHSPEAISVIPLFSKSADSCDLNVYQWWRLFRDRDWNVCLLGKGDFSAGNWSLDFTARCCFQNYLTIEHLEAPSMSPKSSRLHFAFIPGLSLWWYRERFCRFLRALGPKKVICVGDAVKNRLTSDYKFPRNKVVTIRNGIDTMRFRRDPKCREHWRRLWGVPPSAILIGAHGRLSRVKGYETAIAGFQAILRRFPEKELRFVLIGDGPHKPALVEVADRVVPQGRVIFSPFCDRPWEPLSALDFFVMPSLNEGLPLALAEAMACGCCPVATAVGGVSELIENPGLGWLVRENDSDAFAAAMMEAISSTAELRAHMAARAREHVVKNFNADVQFNALADMIESVGPSLGMS